MGSSIVDCKTLTDGSVVLEFSEKTQDSFSNIEEDWDEVYGITEGLDINPIVGKYYCIGSGNYIIVSKDSIYEYYNVFDVSEKRWTGMTLKRCSPLTSLWITKVKQYEYEYTTYVRLYKLD